MNCESEFKATAIEEALIQRLWKAELSALGVKPPSKQKNRDMFVLRGWPSFIIISAQIAQILFDPLQFFSYRQGIVQVFLWSLPFVSETKKRKRMYGLRNCKSEFLEKTLTGERIVPVGSSSFFKIT